MEPSGYFDAGAHAADNTDSADVAVVAVVDAADAAAVAVAAGAAANGVDDNVYHRYHPGPIQLATDV